MRSPLLLGLAAALVIHGQSAVAAQSPRVLRTVPEAGEVDVEPTLKRIEVVFDRDMDRSRASFVGGGPSFPKPAGPPQWSDARSCTLPVQLEAGKAYVFSINGPRHRGFRDSDGVAVEPVEVRFRTADPSLTVPSEEENRASWQRLESAVLKRYSYVDRLGIDWEKHFEPFRESSARARSKWSFAKGVVDALTVAKDPHIWLEVEGEVLATHSGGRRSNFHLDTVRTQVPDLRSLSRSVFVGHTAEGTPYLLLGSLREGFVDVDQVHGFLKQSEQEPALILDIRANTGGAETIAQRIAGCFIDEAVVYAQHVLREEQGFSAPFKRFLQPLGEDGPRFRGQVIVLQGPTTISSAEAFVLMMAAVDNSISIGDRTRGRSGNPQPHDLGNGVTVMLPSWKAMDAEGHEFEGRGLAPDRSVTAREEAFRQHDPVLEAARKLAAEIRARKPAKKNNHD